MTNKDAIYILSGLKRSLNEYCGLNNNGQKAFDMAISALREQYSKTRICDTCKHNPPSKKWPCVDCDMREPADRWEPQEERALDTISRQDAIDEIRKCRFVVDAIEKIIDLPSAQPNLQPTCNQLATDTISRQEAIDALDCINGVEEVLRSLPSAQPEIIHCKDCKYYSPMNKETKTGICNLTMHQNFGDNWFCAGAERRTDD